MQNCEGQVRDTLIPILFIEFPKDANNMGQKLYMACSPECFVWLTRAEQESGLLVLSLDLFSLPRKNSLVQVHELTFE